MIQINSYSFLSDEKSHEAYSLTFHRNKFLILPELNLSTLQFFKKSTQRQCGKTNVKLNLTGFSQQFSFFENANFILMTNYQQILLIPFILRSIPKISIITTSLMFELARIFSKEFINVIKTHDISLQSIPMNQNYEEIIEKYQQILGVDISLWKDLYSEKQLEDCLQKCVKLNYNQIYDPQIGILITAIAAGSSMGSALYQIQSIRTKQRVLWINQLSMHKWRSNQSVNLKFIETTSQIKEFNHIIYSKQATLSFFGQLTDEEYCLTKMKQIQSLLSKNMSVFLILEDETQIMDIIDYFQSQLGTKWRSIFIQNQSTDQMVNYCNSYVEYLSFAFKNRIYNDPPDYPMLNYYTLKQKNRILSGKIGQTAINSKLPIKELIQRNSPYIYIVSSYLNKLKGEELFARLKEFGEIEAVDFQVPTTFSIKNFKEFITQVKLKQIILFEQDRFFESQDFISLNSNSINQVRLNTKYILNEFSEKLHYYKCINLLGGINKYEFLNGQLITSMETKLFLHLKKNWKEAIKSTFKQNNIEANILQNQIVHTQQTVIRLVNFKLKIESKNMQELFILQKCVSNLVNKLVLK